MQKRSKKCLANNIQVHHEKHGIITAPPLVLATSANFQCLLQYSLGKISKKKILKNSSECEVDFAKVLVKENLASLAGQ